MTFFHYVLAHALGDLIALTIYYLYFKHIHHPHIGKDGDVEL